MKRKLQQLQQKYAWTEEELIDIQKLFDTSKSDQTLTMSNQEPTLRINKKEHLVQNSNPQNSSLINSQRYTIQKTFGSGANGEVYQVIDSNLKRLCVYKSSIHLFDRGQIEWFLIVYGEAGRPQ